MNANNPPAHPTPAPALPPINAEPPVYLSRILLGLLLAVAFFDFCFWKPNGTPGFSVAVYFTALTAIILASREPAGRKRAFPLLLALMGGALVESVIETGVTNSLVLLILIVVLAGETFFVGLKSPWSRWMAQIVALVLAPGRVFWLSARLMEVGVRGGLGWFGGVIGGCLLVIPALVLALIFGSLLATGNAVFGDWTNIFFNWVWRELEFFFDLGRVVMWCFVAFVMLPFLRPANVRESWTNAPHLLARLPEILPTRAALFGSGMILVVLNVLFLVANIADALFLWSGRELPAGVTYKAYVHEGVNALIVTVILSAVVLTAIFQQALPVVQRRGLRALAYLWIAQNLFLIFSVAEKLRRYIVFYEMTVARLSTIIFLALVAYCFLLLTIKVARDRSLAQLIAGCLAAVFVTFYTTQFMDLAGWSANYNVARMEQGPGHHFDSKTMCQWGPDVWPALRRAHDLAPTDPDIAESWEQQKQGANQLATGQRWSDWREFSLRAWWNRAALDDKK